MILSYSSHPKVESFNHLNLIETCSMCRPITSNKDTLQEKTKSCLFSRRRTKIQFLITPLQMQHPLRRWLLELRYNKNLRSCIILPRRWRRQIRQNTVLVQLILCLQFQIQKAIFSLFHSRPKPVISPNEEGQLSEYNHLTLRAPSPSHIFLSR
jgi:hypothetical protein